MARPGWPTFNYGAAPASPDHHPISPRCCSTGRPLRAARGESVACDPRARDGCARHGGFHDGLTDQQSMGGGPWRLCRAVHRPWACEVAEAGRWMMCMRANRARERLPQRRRIHARFITTSGRSIPAASAGSGWSFGAWQAAIAAAVENAPLPNPHRGNNDAHEEWRMVASSYPRVMAVRCAYTEYALADPYSTGLFFPADGCKPSAR